MGITVLLSEGLIVILIAIMYRRRRFPLITDRDVGDTVAAAVGEAHKHLHSGKVGRRRIVPT
jgi:hypothetical protein